MSSDLAAVVMAAGLGKRMHSATPKHLHSLLGRRMIDWVLDAGRALEPDPLVVVASPDTAGELAGETVVVQKAPLGTGDAVATARNALAGFGGDVLVLSGDTPLLTPAVLGGLVAEHRRRGADATLLSLESPRPLPYGRVLRDESGGVYAVVEERDATPEQLAVRELNSSIYVFRAPALWAALDRLDPDNAQGELYLTDTIARILEAGGTVAAHASPDAIAAEGVNTRADLAAAAAVLRDRVNELHMLEGVTIVDPATTWIEVSVQLEPDCTIHPFTVLRGSTRVGARAEIGPHAVLVDAVVGPEVPIGPFCYLRPGTVLEARAKAGTFVEIKNSRIGEGSKVPHLSYIGDADIGAGTNLGAGAITANFPHVPNRPKGRTRIGRNVRTAIHNSFVAPVEIGDDAWIAAGSVITDDVPAGALAGFPPRQVVKEGYVYERGERDD